MKRFLAFLVSFIIFFNSFCIPVSAVTPDSPGVSDLYLDPAFYSNTLNDFHSMSYYDFIKKYYGDTAANLYDILDGDFVADFIFPHKQLFDDIWNDLNSSYYASLDGGALNGHPSDESAWNDGSDTFFGVIKHLDGSCSKHYPKMRLKIVAYQKGQNASTCNQHDVVANVLDAYKDGHASALWIEAVTRVSSTLVRINYSSRFWNGTKYLTNRYSDDYFLSTSSENSNPFTYSPVLTQPGVYLFPGNSPVGSSDPLYADFYIDNSGTYIIYNGDTYIINLDDHSVKIGDITYFAFPDVDSFDFDLADKIYNSITTHIINNFAYYYNQQYGSDVDMSGVIAVLANLYNIDSNIYNKLASTYNLNTQIYNQLSSISSTLVDLSTTIGDISVVLSAINANLGNNNSLDIDSLNALLSSLQASIDNSTTNSYDIVSLLTDISTIINSIAQNGFDLNISFDSDGDGVDDTTFVEVLLNLNEAITNIKGGDSYDYSSELSTITNNFTLALTKLDILIELLSTQPSDPVEPDDPSVDEAADFLSAYVELYNTLRAKLPDKTLNAAFTNLCKVVFTDAPPDPLYVQYDDQRYLFLNPDVFPSEIISVVKCFLSVLVLFFWLSSMRKQLSDVF